MASATIIWKTSLPHVAGLAELPVAARQTLRFFLPISRGFPVLPPTLLVTIQERNNEIRWPAKSGGLVGGRFDHPIEVAVAVPLQLSNHVRVHPAVLTNFVSGLDILNGRMVGDIIHVKTRVDTQGLTATPDTNAVKAGTQFLAGRPVWDTLFVNLLNAWGVVCFTCCDATGRQQTTLHRYCVDSLLPRSLARRSASPSTSKPCWPQYASTLAL